MCECLKNHGKPEQPEPPELVKALARARARRRAYADFTEGAGMFSDLPYDVEALVERGEIVPRSLVAGRELGEPIEDLSG
jgi:hypothetical protein